MASYSMRISSMMDRERGFREEMGEDAPIYHLGFNSVEQDAEKACRMLEKIISAGGEIARLLRQSVHFPRFLPKFTFGRAPSWALLPLFARVHVRPYAKETKRSRA
ncbi:MAG: hypothetical protein IJT74_01775 [Bacteroidales bacterium]|nr:hypothetical protein [Bacteroidales bacterium]